MNKSILVVDLEATCWDNDYSKQKREMEIIEIGAVLLDAITLEQTGDFQTFVKPVRNSKLSDFCKSLTTIKQEDVDIAPEFKVALADLVDWMPEGVVLSSWGDFDRKQFQKDCIYHKVAYPFGEHINIKKLFQDKKGVRTGVKRALKKLGLEFEGTPHRGLIDAKNIVRILRKIGL